MSPASPGADPTRGAARREGLLLAAFAVLALIGLWTVAVAELSDDAPPSSGGPAVTAPTENTSPDTQ